MQIKIARTAAEKTAVFHFRYAVYVSQMKLQIMDIIDHKNKLSYNKNELHDNSVLLYAVSHNKIVGTVLLSIFEPGKIPTKIIKRYDLSQKVNISHVRIAQAGSLMLDKNYRGKKIVTSLLKKVYQIAAQQKVDLMFCYCFPGLVHYYIPFGFHPYSKTLHYIKEGITIRLVLIMNEVKYFQKIYSPFLKLAVNFGPNKNLSDFLKEKVFHCSPVITERKKINAVMSSSHLTNKNCFLLRYITLNELKNLCSQVIYLDAKKLFIANKKQDEEIYIVLSGQLKVVLNRKTIITLKKGDLLGEIAFFSQESGHQRIADIYSVTKSVVVMLKRNDLHRLFAGDKLLATRLLLGFCDVISSRLAETTKKNYGY